VLQARAQATSSRGERRELIKAAKVQRELAERDEEKLADLVNTARHLRKQGRDVDTWVAIHGHDAERWVAAEREHTLRGELAKADPPERAFQSELTRERQRKPGPPELAR